MIIMIIIFFIMIKMILCRKYTEESAWIHKTADQLNAVPMKVGNAGPDSDISTFHNCIAHKNTLDYKT